MVDVLPGAVTTANPAQAMTSTCYWVLDRNQGPGSAAKRGWWNPVRWIAPRGFVRTGRGPAWLPLWEWHRAGQRVYVWDYSEQQAAAASSSQQSAFEGRADVAAASAAAAKAAASVDGVAAAPCTVRVYACNGASKGEAFDLIERQILQQESDQKAAARAARRLRSSLLDQQGGAPPLVTVCYGAGGAVVELAAHSAPARADGAGGAAAAAAGMRGAYLSATAAAAAAGLRLHLNFEPRPAGAAAAAAASPAALAAAARPLAAVGSVFLELGTDGLASRGTDLEHRGTHTVTLLFSAESALAQESSLPPWARRQLTLADRATAGSSRGAPPVAALVRNAQGEQWLLCVDALATAAIGLNLQALWPPQPQGLRCWYSRGAPLGQTAAAAVAAAAKPSARRRAPMRGASGLRSQVRGRGGGGGAAAGSRGTRGDGSMTAAEGRAGGGGTPQNLNRPHFEQPRCAA